MTSTSPYIREVEYADYSITDAKAAQVDAAARIINGHLQRPEGLIWSPDANGQPAWMAWKDSSLSLALPTNLSPGSNLQVTFPSANFGTQTIGEVVILDRANSNLAEACVVTGASGNTLTLQSVQFSHSSGASVDFGLTILQESPVPPKRSTVLLSRFPFARMLSAYGRYSYGRRSQQFQGFDVYGNLLAQLAYFGGPPAWQQIDVAGFDVNYNTGEIWVPPGLLLAYFSDVRIRYVSGWSVQALPPNIKQATANIVRAMIDTPYSANNKMLKSGDAAMQRFNASVMDDDTKRLLDPYKARLMV